YCGHRLHRGPPPFGLPGRAARCIAARAMARACAPSGSRPRRHAIDNVALFPLNTVLFPGGRLPLRIFEQRYMEMAKGCLREGTPFGVCLIREGSEVGA